MRITARKLRQIIQEELLNERVNTIAGDPFDMPEELRKAINESRLVNAGGGFEGYGELKGDYWERKGIKEPKVKDSGMIIIGINIASQAGYRRHINLPGALNAYPHLQGQVGNHLRLTNPDGIDPAESGNMVLLEDDVFNQLKAWLDKTMPMYKRAKKMADDAGETGFDGLGNAKSKIEMGKEAFAKDYAASGAGRAEAMGLNESNKVTVSYLRKLIKEEIQKTYKRRGQ